MMDAAAVEGDVKLYKASAELLDEFRVKIPLLLKTPDGRPREWTLSNKTADLTRILDTFQEWPQLLDPVLADIVSSLAEAFLAYCLHSNDAYYRHEFETATQIEPLPRAICRLLYTLCKVRGYKVIVHLLNNQPKFIEPLLVSLRIWRHPPRPAQRGISWEERYIILLWLSHLMLAPFALATISGFSLENAQLPESLATFPLPAVARVLLTVAFEHLYSAGKDREAASLLIVRLSLREDMQRLFLPEGIIQWCTTELIVDESGVLSDQYRHVGLLTLLYGITNSSSSTEVAAKTQRVFEISKFLALDQSVTAVAVRQSAQSRKLMVKIVRASILHSLALSTSGDESSSQRLDLMLEDGIQILLEWLADTDTPVRQAASKALGAIVLKLESDMAAEVVEAVLGCLSEGLLLEDLRTGHLTAATDLMQVDMSNFKKNVNAVDPLKWHGAMLTLGHVLFRRSPPPDQLSLILEALLMGLTFEQRSSAGTSLGVAVRDAACFGVWSLARKYTTQEVDKAHINAISGTSRTPAQYQTQRTLQVIATELVLASCLDPSGNLRRGASAALQELIGRHPDTIQQGIPLVQQVDYHAVARRSRAIAEVAEAVANLDKTYHSNLLYALLDWRGCRSVDPESRRQAASTIGTLFSQASCETQVAFAGVLTSQIGDLKEKNVGANAAARHGLLLAIAALLQTISISSLDKPVSQSAKAVIQEISPITRDIDHSVGDLSGRVTTDLSYVLEATARAIQAMITAKVPMASSTTSILERCTTASDDDTVALTAAYANIALFGTQPLATQLELIESWLPADSPKTKSHHTCKGRLATVGLIFPLLTSNQDLVPYASRIGTFLALIPSSALSIERKINAMQAISTILKSKASRDAKCLQSLADAVLIGLADYTIDSRGDIGSLLRLSSIDAVRSFNASHRQVSFARDFAKALTRLSAERLTKVRLAAWDCLQQLSSQQIALSVPTFGNTLSHLADVSSIEYYLQLMELYETPWLRDELLQGLVSSIAGGSDDISKVSIYAVVSFLNMSDEQTRIKTLQYIIDYLLKELRSLAKHEDREVVPLLDTLCLIIEQFPNKTRGYLLDKRPAIMTLITALQPPSADIARIQSLLRLLSHLSSIGEFRLDAADKISRKLLHKWPRVRHAALDGVYLLDDKASADDVDWNAQPLINKDKVVELRKVLGVAGRAATTT